MTEMLAEAPEMDGISLRLEGTWREIDAPADLEPTPFLIETSAAHGTLPHLQEVLVGGEGTSAVVTIERQLGTLFEDVDFRAMSTSALERAVLANLMDNVTIDLILNQ